MPTLEGEKLDRDGFPILPGKRGIKMTLVPGGARTRAYGQRMDRIAGTLTGQVGGRVVDGTGLAGYYDCTLAFATWASGGLPAEVRGEAPAGRRDGTGVPITGAIRQQLGPKLEPTKITIDVLVVDSIDKTPVE